MKRRLAGTAYSYIRFSSKIQERGDSLRRQRELRDEWLARNPGVKLDESLTLEDLGTSAFRGKHRGDKFALGQFLKLVETGRIPSGSILVVENLDRLSRQEVGEAVELFLGIVNRGIVVVQLMPSEQVFAKPVDLTTIIVAVVEMARGNSESAAKSERVTSRWSERKRLAAEGKGIVTARAPAWLKVVSGKFEFKPGARETLRRIFSLCAGGMGCRMITATFNREKVPTWTKSPMWEEAYIRKIVHSWAVIGEHQSVKAGEPDGKPIQNYYPAAVSETEFLAAQGALAERNNRGGRPPKSPEFINPFNGLLKYAGTGDTVNILVRKDYGGQTYRVLSPAAHKRWAESCISYPQAVFERAVLSKLAELDPAEIFDEAGGSDILVLTGKLAGIEGRIASLKAKLVASDEDCEPLIDVLRQLETTRKEVADQLVAEKIKVASPHSSALGECNGLIQVLDSAANQQEARVRLKSALRRIASEIRCLFVQKGEVRLAAVQVFFVNGRQRSCLVVHRPPRYLGKKGMRPAETVVRSFESAAMPDCDLRNQKQAAELEQMLLEHG